MSLLCLCPLACLQSAIAGSHIWGEHVLLQVVAPSGQHLVLLFRILQACISDRSEHASDVGLTQECLMQAYGLRPNALDLDVLCPAGDYTEILAQAEHERRA